MQDYIGVKIEPRPFLAEEWNLLFLSLDFDGRPFAKQPEDIMTRAWKSVACSSETPGVWTNPHMDTNNRRVAELLRGSPYAFVEWAKTAKVARTLPIVCKSYDKWLERITERAAKCAPHPDDAYHIASMPAFVKPV